MARYIRFDEAFMDRIRASVDLVGLIGREVTLRRAGKNFIARCPFHEEKTPSFNVNPVHNQYRCFGCGEHGDAIAWLRKKHNLPFQEAVVQLAEACGLPLPATEHDETGKAERRHLARLYQALIAADGCFSRELRTDHAALTWLQIDRHLEETTIAKFGLGVVRQGVARVLARTVSSEIVVEAGLAMCDENGELRERFRHRVMFPIHNEGGHVIGFAGRTMQPGVSPKYLNSPETLLFHKGQELYGLHHARGSIRQSRTAVVVEGYLDVITLHQAGETRAVAPMGTAMTGKQMQRVLNHADLVIFAFDGDRAGRSAAQSAALVFLEEMRDGKSARFAQLPEGIDPDDLMQRDGIQTWSLLLDQAAPLSSLLAGQVAADLNLVIPEHQVVAAVRAGALLARIKHADTFRRALKTRFESLIGIALD